MLNTTIKSTEVNCIIIKIMPMKKHARSEESNVTSHRTTISDAKWLKGSLRHNISQTIFKQMIASTGESHIFISFNQETTSSLTVRLCISTLLKEIPSKVVTLSVTR